MLVTFTNPMDIPIITKVHTLADTHQLSVKSQGSLDTPTLITQEALTKPTTGITIKKLEKVWNLEVGRFSDVRERDLVKLVFCKRGKGSNYCM